MVRKSVNWLAFYSQVIRKTSHKRSMDSDGDMFTVSVDYIMYIRQSQK